MDYESSQEVTQEQIDGLADKLTAFSQTLEKSEQALLEAFLLNSGDVGESEVEGFSFGDFRSAAGIGLNPLGGGILGAVGTANWAQWTKKTADGWSKSGDSPHNPQFRG